MRKTVVRKTEMRKTNIRKTTNKLAENQQRERERDNDQIRLEKEPKEKLFFITGRGSENVNPHSRHTNNNNVMRKTQNKVVQNELIGRISSNVSANSASAKENERKTKARFTKNRITKFIRKTTSMSNNSEHNYDSDEDKDLLGLKSSGKKKNNMMF